MTTPLATVLKPEGQWPTVLIRLDGDSEWPVLFFPKGREKKGGANPLHAQAAPEGDLGGWQHRPVLLMDVAMDSLSW